MSAGSRMRLRQYHILTYLKLSFNISQVHGILQKIVRHPGEPNSKQIRKLCHKVCRDFIYTFFYPWPTPSNPIHAPVLPVESYLCVYFTTYSCFYHCCYHCTPGQRLVFLLFSQPQLFLDLSFMSAICETFLKPKVHYVISCLKLLNCAPFDYKINNRLLNLTHMTHGVLP